MYVNLALEIPNRENVSNKIVNFEKVITIRVRNLLNSHAD